MILENLIEKKLELACEIDISLKNGKGIDAKLHFLLHHPNTLSFLNKNPELSKYIFKFGKKNQILILTLIAIGQGVNIFSGSEDLKSIPAALKELCHSLEKIEHYYDSIGGLLGYYIIALRLIVNKKKGAQEGIYSKPPGLKIEENDPKIKEYVRASIENLHKLGEVYPVGGAADRLNLKDEKTNLPLPQACLKFFGKTLLEGLISDLEAREKIYEKTFGEKITTPIALMTSQEKNNTALIYDILEANEWFNRPKELFKLFEQPLVPMISEEGSFAIKGPFTLHLKPGGHGMIWMLMHHNHIFKWFEDLGREYLIIRQINNPLGGLDMNLFALFGQGVADDKAFGFLTCQRRLKASEGVNILRTIKTEDSYASAITNIEYTDFAEKGIIDQPEYQGSIYSIFPSNTNILYGKIREIKKALNVCHLPGKLINMKNQVEWRDDEGNLVKSLGGRLESTMQNIADAMNLITQDIPEEHSKLKTFAIYNDRSKTISVTKVQWHQGRSYHDTPLGAFLDKLDNHFKLLAYCGFDLPEFSHEFPPLCHIDYHPKLGPLYSVIRQKLRKGKIAKHSELIIQADEVDIENLDLQGSLIIKAKEGRVRLKNVTIRNKGIDHSHANNYLNGDIKRAEAVEIIILGNGEFEAENLTIDGPGHFEISPGEKGVLKMQKNKLKFDISKQENPSWTWVYTLNPDNTLTLTLKP